MNSATTRSELPERGRGVATVDDRHASATRLTGLADFGADDSLDGLAMLLESYAADEDLTPLGAKMSRVFLRGALVARVLSESAWRRYPDHAAVGIDQPVFVTDSLGPARRRCTGCSRPIQRTRASNCGSPRRRS